MINIIRQLLENTIKNIFSESIGNQQIDFSIERPNNDKHGDFSSNIALKLASTSMQVLINNS